MIKNVLEYWNDEDETDILLDEIPWDFHETEEEK